MGNYIKRILILFLTISVLMGSIPIPQLNTSEVDAADIEQSQYMKFETGYSKQGLDSSYGAYRIWGIDNGHTVQTTYAEEGFRVTLKVGGQNYSAGILHNGVEKNVISNLAVTENLSIVNNGRYVKVQLVVKNYSNAAQTFSLGSGADVQIGNNDTAPITKFDNGSGFYMTDGLGAQFNFIGKNAYGVTNVDTFWYGGYSYVNENMFTQINVNSLPAGTDSGMAFAWNNRTIQPGTSQSYSILIGIGDLNAPPVSSISSPAGSSFPDGTPGGSFTFSGNITDTDNTPGVGVYYAIDNRTPVNAYTFPGAPGNFTATINIPADITPGSHTVSIYAQDTAGGISSEVTRTFNVPAPMSMTGHNLSYTSGGGAKFIDPNFIVNYDRTVTGGKIYIDQNFNSSKDSLNFTNSGGITGSYNATSGVLTMTGTTTAANYQNFIRNVKFNSSDTSGTRKIMVSLTTGSGSILYFSGTGHYYEYVASNGISWTSARDAAAAKTYDGLTGYLATITSAAENAFVASKCAGDGWLGGTDQGTDKQWYWVTGPEAGSKFCQQNAGGAGVAYTVSGWYQNFATGEPNDYPSGAANSENYLHMYSADGTWNDYAYNSASIKGYLIEYGTTSLAASGSVASIDVTFSDITGPSVNITGNASSWTNSNVIITVTASDSGSGLNVSGAYSYNGGPWTTANSQAITTNGTVNVRVRDNDGNITSQDVLINKIDKTAPTFTGITQTPAPENWTGNSVTLTVNGASDNAGSGLNAAAYSFSSVQGVYNWQASSTSQAFNSNQTVYVYVRDALGNISEPSTVNISNIDLTLPNTPLISNSQIYTVSNWYNTDRTITASFISTTGCAETLQYKLDNESWINANSITISQEGAHILKFRVIDELGRISGEAICNVQIDKTLPQVSADDINTSWRNSNFSVTLPFSDLGGSGVKTREYALTNSNIAPEAYSAANASQIVDIYQDGLWYIHYKVVDNAGNVRTGNFGPYKLDKTIPAGSISIRPEKTCDGIDFTRSQVVTIDLTQSDNLSNVSQMRFANSLDELSSAVWESFNSVKNNFGLSNVNGLKTVYYQLKDNAGNMSLIYSDTIYFDNVKAKLTISAPSQYVAKRGDVITYTVNFTDNSVEFGNNNITNSNGIDYINFGSDKVILSAFGSVDLEDILISVQEVAGQPYKRLISLTLPGEMEGEGSINLKVASGAAEDMAGNISDETLCGFSFSIDNIPPVNQNSLFVGDITVKGGSVIALNNTSVNTGGHESDSVRFAPVNYAGESANTTTITSTHGASLFINAPLNEGEYYIYVVDSAGNISEKSISKLIVDNTGPLIELSQPNKTIANNEAVIEYLITFPDDATLDSINTLFRKSKIGFESTGSANALLKIENVTGNDRQKKIIISGFTGNGKIDSLVIASDICRDITGNSSVEIIENTDILVDNTIPSLPTVTLTKVNNDTLSKVLNFVTFGYFWNDQINVTIHSSDIGGSNLAKIYYKAAENDPYIEEIPDVDGNITFTLPIGFKGNIWAYAKDNSDNISAVIKSDGIISENNAPQIAVSPVDLSNWFNSDLQFNVTVTDNEGIKEIRYTVDGNENIIDMITGYTDKQTSKEFTIPLTSDSLGHTIQINVVDLAGNNAETYNGTVKIDKSLPVISSVTGNPTDWTDNSVTLTVNANDAVSGLASMAYSFDGGATWQSENTKTYAVNTNGIVIKVKDTAGNIATYETIDITKIDKTLPDTAVIGDADKYTDNNWYNQNQTITASFSTTQGCDERLQYKINGGSWTDGNSVTIANEGEYTVFFRVMDYLGRNSTQQSVDLNIDKTAPTDSMIKLNTNEFTSFLNDITFGLFFKETVDIAITTNCNISGVSKIEYQKVAQKSEYDPNGAWVNRSSFSVLPDEQFIIYAKITDNAGNFVIINTNGVIVDATNPELTLVPDLSNWATQNINVAVTSTDNLAGLKEVTYTTNETVPQSGTVVINDGQGVITLQNEGQYVLTVTAEDASGNAITQAIDIKLDKSLPNISSVTGNPADWTDNSVTLTVTANDSVSGLSALAYSFDGGATWQSENTKTYELNTNGIVIKVKDTAGNIATYETIDITKIDKTLPNTSVIADPDKYTDNNWYNQSQTITASFASTEGCDERLQYKINEGNWIDGNSVSIANEGEYTVFFRVMDYLGRSGAQQSVDVNIDKTAPTEPMIKLNTNEFTSFLNDITFGLFFKETVDVTITANSNISGVSKIEYQKVEQQSEYDPNGTWINGNSFSVVPDEQFIIYAKITDNAGNYVIINTNGAIVDATNPGLTLVPDKSNWATQNINVTVTSTDNLAGLKEVTYTTNETVPQSGTVVINEGQGVITLQNEGQYVLTVTSRDSSDNAISKTLDIKLDKSLPIINSVTGNPVDWTDNSVTLTVTANDAVSGLAALAYSFDGGATWQSENTETYAVNTNGIVIKVRDIAGNIATYETVDITKIDKTLPDTAAIADAEKYTDDNWYNKSQTITASFAVTEGCDERLQYKINEGTWTDGNSVTITNEGEYTVFFRVMDYLGRCSSQQCVDVNIDKTAPTDSMIKLNTNEFTSFLNNITFGLFFKDTVDVTISSNSNISGVSKIEYQKVAQQSDYNPDGAWINGNSLSVLPNQQFIIYAKITDKAGNYVIINTDGAVVDATIPELTLLADLNDWETQDINITVTSADNLAGLKEVTYTTNEVIPQSGNVLISGGQGKITLQNEGNYVLTVTAKDTSNNVISKTLDIKLDKSLPVISSVTGNATDWTDNNITLTVNANDSISGLAILPYSFDGGQTWQSENTKTFTENSSGIVIKVRDNAGFIATYNTIDITKIDKTLPNTAVIANSDKYTVNNWYNQSQTITASFTATPGCDAKLQYKLDDGAWVDGSSVVVETEGVHKVSYRVLDYLGRTSSEQVVNVNIDKQKPALSGANEGSNYFIGRLIEFTDNFGELNILTYRINGGNEKSFVSGDLFGEVGRYTVTVKDKAGNESILTFNVKPLPKVEEVLYTAEYRNLIKSIREEFNGNSNLPQPYKNNMDNEIKKLENRFNLLESEVAAIKSNVSKIKSNVEKLPNSIDGLIAMKDQILTEYKKVADDTSTLTAQQKSELVQEKEYLKDQLAKIDGLIGEVDTISGKIDKIPTQEDGLISKHDEIQNILNDISKLTNEQQTLLKDKTAILKDLLDKIVILQNGVTEVKDIITSLPLPEKVIKEDAEKITKANDLYTKLNNEQKHNVGEDLTKKLTDVTEALRKLMLYDSPTDITVIGIDGTTFSPDVYLKVIPVDKVEQKANFAIAAKKVNNQTQANQDLEDKELVALFDVSMFQGNTKIQPDGRVQVKIKIPDNLLNRNGLEIIHVADDGTVTVMYATREGDYLVFTTDHFSEYGIIAKDECLLGICKLLGIYDNAEGKCYCLIIVGSTVVIVGSIGYVVYRRKRKKKINNEDDE